MPWHFGGFLPGNMFGDQPCDQQRPLGRIFRQIGLADLDIPRRGATPLEQQLGDGDDELTIRNLRKARCTPAILGRLRAARDALRKGGERHSAPQCGHPRIRPVRDRGTSQAMLIDELNPETEFICIGMLRRYICLRHRHRRWIRRGRDRNGFRARAPCSPQFANQLSYHGNFQSQR